ncbi:ATP synthase epsilon chain [Caldithrix abyssi DSM 13497]|uniref:ATP synthase epsilon chain n=1 Tax=Caldithrix abyssi DSM 13497 TaxID=880073 RepID=H1XNT9_CALAY|nr:F0F1 ATP synthase subunit epsilon [Caldithrix abyssi]APF19774.1 atpC ATP synthase F1 subcomplex epsilon subunit [Caldithrix abyssi DSM 13497]EHO39879.1 ATP synthase epsilon chain [Caldithrix abyssi DSM 13497]
MATEFELVIVTPFGEVYRGEVRSCTLPGYEGLFQVLPNHANLISVLEIGPLKVLLKDGKERYIALNGGYCEVKDNALKIMAESAEFAEDIDVERANAARQRAEQRLHSKHADIDIPRAQLALAKALNRLRVAQLK